MIKKYWINNRVRFEQETNNNAYFNLHANRYSCQYKEQLRLTSVFFDFEHCLYFKADSHFDCTITMKPGLQKSTKMQMTVFINKPKNNTKGLLK